MPTPTNLYNPFLPRQIPPLRIFPSPTLSNLFPNNSPLPSFPRLPSSSSPSERNNYLLIIPTANASKTTLLKSHLTNLLPPSSTLSTLTIPATSNAGEQPYDSLGPIGAYNRILNALNSYSSSPSKHKGTIIIASIENFIQIDGEKGIDYGFVVIYNGSTGHIRRGISRGVEVPKEYLKEARKYGFEDEEKGKGKVTIGEVLEANLGGRVEKADWHRVLTEGGVSRYELLREALEGVGVPW
ncbi:hypothetical protein QBC38DRAFT_466954 [Podospora fimiseda]|uniref:Non-canonical purine NTP phosphatase/PRRC1 domain-containing protein n=1 Tax=Podospora fimiseda TaxID=252190 RepID=A0AAN7BWX9_9PEZI|nr:hypothetical protein QBC38DRAFT_466954 [Podospora fimiseda]